jgi:3-methyladenine DNA glycosylase/8-oxoguanine DNA glycosylase
VTSRTGSAATPAVRLRLRASAPFRLGAVVESHGWFQTPPFGWDRASQTLQRVESLPGGIACLTVRPAEGGVTVEVDRPLDACDRAELRTRIRRMLQLDVDVAGFADALSFDPALAADLAAHGAGRLLAGTTLYEDVVKAICGTNTAWRRAVAAIAQIGAWGRHGAFPEPDAVLRAGAERLRAEARVGYRAPYLLAAARAALDGTLAEIEAEARGAESRDLERRLRELPGVGPATAAFLCLLLGRFDVLVIDSATYRHAGRAWFGGRRPSRREIAERVSAAGAWRGLALYWAMLRAWQRETGIAVG